MSGKVLFQAHACLPSSSQRSVPRWEVGGRTRRRSGAGLWLGSPWPCSPCGCSRAGWRCLRPQLSPSLALARGEDRVAAAGLERGFAAGCRGSLRAAAPAEDLPW